MPLEERKYKDINQFGEGDQAKVCLDIMHKTGAHLELSMAKDQGLSIMVSGKLDSVMKARKEIVSRLQTQVIWNIIYRVRTVMKNLEKSWNFKTAFSRPGKVLEKWINPESFGKVMEIYFTNLCIIQLCLFGSWISVRDCAWAISHISTLSRSFRL